MDLWTPAFLDTGQGRHGARGLLHRELQREAVAQIPERGYPIAEVSKRLEVNQHSLFQRKEKFRTSKSSADGVREAELRRLKQELTRDTEEREPARRSSCFRRGAALTH